MKPNEFQMVIYWSDEDQAYLVEVPELPGCMADDRTRQEAITNAEIIIREWIAARDLGRPIPNSQGRLLTVSEAAERLGLSVAMVRRYCANGKLSARKIGRDWAIQQHDVEHFAATPRFSGRPYARYTSSLPVAQRVSEK